MAQAREIHIRLAVDRPVARWLFVGLLLAAPFELGSETLTLTTSYPPVTGIYDRIITTGDATTGRDTILNQLGGNTLLAEGSGVVGVGATNLNFKLNIAGDYANSDKALRGNLKVSGRVQVGAISLGEASTTGSTPSYGSSGGHLRVSLGNSATFRVTDRTASAAGIYAQVGPAVVGGQPGMQIAGDLDLADASASCTGGNPCGHVRACDWEPYSSAGTCNNGYPIYVESTGTSGPFNNSTGYPPAAPAGGSLQLCCRYSTP